MSVRPITDTLRQLRGGVFLDEASDELNRVVNAVSDTGKAGKLVLELSIKKATRGGAMIITDKIKATVPEEGPLETMLFATPEGNLVEQDPRQHNLALKEVGSSEPKPIKEVSQQ